MIVAYKFTQCSFVNMLLAMCVGTSLVGECGSASGVIIIHKLNMAACKRIHVLLKK